MSTNTISLKDHAERAGAWMPGRFGSSLLHAYNCLADIPAHQQKALYFLRLRYDCYQVIFAYYSRGQVCFNINEIRPLNGNRFKVDQNFYLNFISIQNLVRRVFENDLPLRGHRMTLVPINEV